MESVRKHRDIMRNKDCAYESEDPKWKERVETLTRDLSERDDLFSPFPVLVMTIKQVMFQL